MKNRAVGRVGFFLALGTLVCLLCHPTFAQSGADRAVAKLSSASEIPCIGCSVDGKTTPRTPDGHPDLSGFWDNPFNGVVVNRPDGSHGFLLGVNRNTTAPPPERSEPSYKPEYAAKVHDLIDKTSFGPTSALDPLQHCKPLGVPRSMVPPLHIAQTRDVIVILYEPDAVGQTFRMIYMDGRQHPKDLDPSYMGDSIGHWDGDTLVVDVTGLNDETWLGGGQQTEKYALMHSDQEHVIERYTRTGDVLTYEATVEDPVVLTKPWVITPRHITHGGQGDRLYETFCDNRDISHYTAPTPEDNYIPGKSF